jgi:hypothetical protein
MWGGFMVARGCLGCFPFAALARLRFAPPEIFAQRRLQPMAPQIVVVALSISLAPLIRHLKNPPGIFCQVFGDLISPAASTRSILAPAAKKAEPGLTNSAQAVPVLAPAGGLWQEPPPVAAFSGRYFS